MNEHIIQHNAEKLAVLPGMSMDMALTLCRMLYASMASDDLSGIVEICLSMYGRGLKDEEERAWNNDQE